MVFGLVFALGDFLTSGSDIPIEETRVVNNKISENKKSKILYTRRIHSPKDPTAFEGSVVTLIELGEYNSSSLSSGGFDQETK